MKRYRMNVPVFIVALFLWATGWNLQAQLTLNPGEDWNWPFRQQGFSNWFLIQGSQTAPPGGVNGHFIATLDANTPPGTVLRCDVYEGLYFGGPTDGQPLSTFIHTTPPNTITSWVANAWQDREGMVRFSVLSGSATINVINLELDIRSAIGLNRWDYWYHTFVPPVAAPRLNISYSSNSVQLRWWTNVSTGYLLEMTNAVGGPSWLAVSTPPAISNGQNFVILNTTGTSRGFFRLRR